MSKFKLHLLGWITLIVFPAPAVWALWYFEDISLIELLSFDELSTIYPYFGVQFGFFMGMIAWLFMQTGLMPEEDGAHQIRMIKSLKLNVGDILFMSFCAGFGEEILFRAGIQHWCGPWITSILFIALHGYLIPWSFKKSIYGIFVLPFILSLAFAYEEIGLWFCIGAHFSYDLLLFWAIKIEAKKL